MSYYTLLTRSVAVGFSMFASTLLFGQTASPTTADASEKSSSENLLPVVANKRTSDEPVRLDPFVVKTELDKGFLAMSSLSGGRLASDLKTTPGSYSVQTRDFIDALGLINFATAAEWSVNTGTSQDEGRNELFGNPVQMTIRGVSGNGVQRNFFPVNVNFDSYNVERFDYSRGPNAVLFGMGSFGGTPNIVTKQARIGKNFGSVGLAVASWDHYRTTVDYNVSDDKRLALRINGLWQESEGWRSFERDDRQAIHLTGALRPWKNTTLNGEFEDGKLTKNNPVTGITDRFLGWDGVTTVTGPMTTIPADANALGITRLGSSTSPVFVYAPNYNPNSIVNLANTALTLGGGAAPGVTTVGGIPTVGSSLNLAGSPFNQSYDLPNSVFNRAITGTQGKFFIPSRDFAISTDTPTSTMKYRIYSGSVDQRIGQDFFVQAAGHYSTTDFTTNYLNQRGLSDTYIDINKTLLDGSPNPKFLQPFNQGNRVRATFFTEQYDARLTAAWIKQDTFLGDFAVNVIGGRTWLNTSTTLYNYVAHNGPEARSWTQNGQIAYRYYWNDTSRPVPDINKVSYYNPSTGTTTELPASFILSNSRSLDSGKTIRNYDYLQSAVKWDTFKNKLHVLGAARRDKVNIRSLTGLANPRDYGANWDGLTIYRLPTAPADYTSLTYRLKDAAGVASGPVLPADNRPRAANGDPLPQYANDRFRSDYSPPIIDFAKTTYTVGVVYDVTSWLSLVGNQATSFIPGSGLQKYNGEVVSPRVSKGRDVGVRFSFFDSKVTANVTYYQGEEVNQGFDSQMYGPLNNVITANPIGDFSPGGLNIRGLPPIGGVPQDTLDRETNGFEFEAVANLAKAWRISANLALPKSYQSNVSPGFRAYMAANDRVLRQILADAGVLISATGVASLDASVPVDDRSPDAVAAAAGWNSLQASLANIVTARQLLPRQNKVLANLFADYSFQSQMLKGVRVGGGVNYRGKQVVGFRGADTMVDPSNPALAIDDPKVDALTPVWTDDYYLFTVVAGYTRKLSDKLTLRLDFRVENLFDQNDPLYVATVQRPPAGQLSSPARVATPTQFYFNNPRRFSLSSTLSF